VRLVHRVQGEQRWACVYETRGTQTLLAERAAPNPWQRSHSLTWPFFMPLYTADPTAAVTAADTRKPCMSTLAQRTAFRLCFGYTRHEVCPRCRHGDNLPPRALMPP
jgi:hypothetical protein